MVLLMATSKVIAMEQQERVCADPSCGKRFNTQGKWWKIYCCGRCANRVRVRRYKQRHKGDIGEQKAGIETGAANEV